MYCWGYKSLAATAMANKKKKKFDQSGIRVLVFKYASRDACVGLQLVAIRRRKEEARVDEAPLSRWRIMHVSRIRTCWAYIYVCGRGSSVWKSPFFRWIYVYLLVASALPQVLSARHFAYIPDPLDDKLWAFYLPTLLLD